MSSATPSTEPAMMTAAESSRLESLDGRIQAHAQVFEQRVQELKVAHHHATNDLKTERDQVLLDIATRQFNERPLGCVGTTLFVEIPRGHPLDKQSGNVNGLFDRPDCPFRTHWGHLSVSNNMSGITIKNRSFISCCKDITFLKMAVHDHENPTTRWSDDRILQARQWLQQQVVLLAPATTTGTTGTSGAQHYNIAIQPHQMCARRRIP